jgi:hypothetical protein
MPAATPTLKGPPAGGGDAIILDDRDARLMLLDMAGTYDRLAQRAEKEHRDSEDPK